MLHVQNGIPLVLSAMRQFKWEENVQTKANWLLAILAANYSDYLGKQGAVEAVVYGMQACEESYQVQISGTRCLQNLISGNESNAARAHTAGAEKLLEENLERNPEDGQLQWRGQALLTRLRSMTSEQLKQAVADNKSKEGGAGWSRLAKEVSAGNARKIAEGNIPGFHGVAAQVAEKAKLGVVEVVNFMRDRPGSADVAKWCCDAIYTMINGNAELRDAAYDANAVDIIIARMNAHLWEEELQLKAIWALLAFAPSYANQIGDKGGIDALVVSMLKNKTNHDVQVAAIKLLSLLSIEPTQNNVRRAREANAITVVKAVIQAHIEDGTLQFRGINLLERLVPGCTASMPKVNLIRSASMRAEELVMSMRSMARIASARGMSVRDMVGSNQLDADAIARNAQAIAEVDELAHQVDEDESEAEDHASTGRSQQKLVTSATAEDFKQHTEDNAEEKKVDTTDRAAAAAEESTLPGRIPTPIRAEQKESEEVT